jgi:hypothetical protein
LGNSFRDFVEFSLEKWIFSRFLTDNIFFEEILILWMSNHRFCSSFDTEIQLNNERSFSHRLQDFQSQFCTNHGLSQSKRLSAIFYLSSDHLKWNSQKNSSTKPMRNTQTSALLTFIHFQLLLYYNL